MLVEFSVTNFRSLKEKQTLSFVTNTSPHTVSTECSKVPTLLKRLSIMGPNASGKSNLIKAMVIAKHIINSSHRYDLNENLKYEPYLLKKEYVNEPTEFEFVFIIESTLYQYGFAITGTEIFDEWLFATPKEGREQKWFLRTTEKEKNDWYINSAYLKGRRKEWIHETRKNTLLLSILGTQKNIEIPRKIIEFIQSCTIISSVDSFPNIFTQVETHKSPDISKKVLLLLKRADLGIADIKTKTVEMTDEYIEALKVSEIVKKEIKRDALGKQYISTKTIHISEDNEEVPFDLDEHESDGTKLFYALAYPLIDILENGRVLIVDELNKSLHCKEVHFILDLFANKETNPKGAQIAFTTHDVTVLQKLDKDEIYFIDKTNGYASELMPLSDFENRNKVSFFKRYMEGLYGAIPHIDMGV